MTTGVTMAKRIDGKAIAKSIRSRVAEEVAATYGAAGRPPGLATILVGDDPASAVYVAGKRRAVREAGLRDLHQSLPGEVTQDAAAAVIDGLAGGPGVSGILLHLPLPNRLGSTPLLDRT